MTDAAENGWILPLLDSPRPSGQDTILAFCPAHPDGEKHGKRDGRSLSYQKSTGLIHCFAGCSGADVLKAFRERRPREAREFKARDRAPDGAWAETAVYSYGLAEHVRLERPDPTSPKGHAKKFIWRVSAADRRTLREAGLSEADLPLYGLETLAGTEPGTWINFAEGEKVVDALRARNQPAVCACGGASQRDFGQALDVLRGRRVRIWPDNDPAGAKYAAVVRGAVTAAGAERVVMMSPIPGFPGADLADHFAGGGALDDLLTGILEDDAVEFAADDHVLVRIPTAAGEIAFDVAEIVEGPRDLQCHITVTWKAATAERPYSQHINLLSSSGCEALARILGKHFHDAGVVWVSLVNRLVAHVREALAQIDITDVTPPDPDEPPARLIVGNPPIVEEGGTILAAFPKAGKSQTALLIAVTADAGIQDGVFHLEGGTRRTLYINLERSRKSMLARLARVNEALGVDPRRPLRFVHARGQGLSRILRQVKRAIRDYDIELVVLDSISRGGFGDLNANQTANGWVDAMNGLQVAWLALGHLPRPKEDDSGTPHLYGSIMQDAGADVLCLLVSKPGRAGTLLVSITTTAANDLARPPMLDLVYEFDGTGLSSARRADDDERADLEEVKTLTIKQLILASLRDEGSASTMDLARRLGKKHPNISRELAHLQRQHLVRKDGDRWSLTPEAYHPSTLDTYRDTGRGEQPYHPVFAPPLKGGGTVVIRPRSLIRRWFRQPVQHAGGRGSPSRGITRSQRQKKNNHFARRAATKSSARRGFGGHRERGNHEHRSNRRYGAMARPGGPGAEVGGAPGPGQAEGGAAGGGNAGRHAEGRGGAALPVAACDW